MTLAVGSSIFISDIDECTSDNPCVHGECNNSQGSYSCVCGSGYNGTNCDEGKKKVSERNLDSYTSD